MASRDPALPIEPQHLEEYFERATRALNQIKWKPAKPGLIPTAGDANRARVQAAAAAAQVVLEETTSLLALGKVISHDPALMSENVNKVLLAIRRGYQIGAHVSVLYTKATNLDALIQMNKSGRLTDAQKSEFRLKSQTASIVALFAMAYYVVWELSQYKKEEVSAISFEAMQIPEISMTGPNPAMDCALFYFGMFAERGGLIRTDLDFVKLAIVYFNALISEIKLKEESLGHADAFTSKTYQLTGTEFCLQGFAVDLDGTHVSVEFNRVDIGDIVGNHDSKHYARRLAERLMCYDFTQKKNPVSDLGGLSPVNMGHGEPGTGKSMVIAMTATLIHDYCELVGVPFLFHPMPDTVVSTFQGGSAERMASWIAALRDPSKIVYMPIDDAENNLEERTRQGVSAGVREVIGVFLRNTEGAYAVNHGNAAVELYTNIPDQIDRAVISRVNRRIYIGGATDWKDFVDQDYLWWKKYQKMDGGFVAMTDPKNYPYLSAQALLKSLSDMYASTKVEPEEASVRTIYDAVLRNYDINSHEFFAHLYAEVKKAFRFFTSRDVRNIQRAVDGRIMDFDFPEEWREKPDAFFRKPYEEKMDMLKVLTKENMKGLSFAEIRLQEAVRYLDNMVRIADTGKRRNIEQEAEAILVRKAAIALAEQGGEHA